MSKKVAGLATATALSITALVGGAYAVSTPATQLAGSSVQLRRTSDDALFCSATHIGGGKFITAWHCVDAVKQASVATDTGEKAAAEVLWSSKLYDLALVRATGLELRPAAIDCGLAPVGTPVFAVGNPLGLEFIRTEGKVITKEIRGAMTVGFDKIWEERIFSNITIAPGSSGGGLFNAATGKLVGVNVGAFIGFNYAISVPSTTVCQLLGR